MDMSRHPSTDSASSMESPTFAGDHGQPNEVSASVEPPVIPSLPALITALPGDPASQPGAGITRAPQTEFIRSRQVEFLENLSITGSVRSAASAAGVSHQTAYRALAN